MGLKPEDIDVVVNSHLHPDHCGCNAYFTKATFMVHEKEVAAAKEMGRGCGIFGRRLGRSTDADGSCQWPT